MTITAIPQIPVIPTGKKARKRLGLLLALVASMAPAQTFHGVLLSWNQSPTPGITSNALKCGTTSKNYPLKWTFGTPTTNYDWLTNDATNPPVQGQTYFCIVTASIGGIESGPSPELSFPFPTVPLSPPNLQRVEH